MPAARLDFWFDFASTYSYPAAMRIGPLAKKSGVVVRFRPFLLGPIFKAQGWDTSPFNLYEAKGRHMWRDLERICADLSLPFRRPQPFPQNSLLAARVALAELERSESAKSGTERIGAEQVCLALFRAEFGEGRRIDDTAAIGDILSGLKLDAASMLAAAQSAENKMRLRAQTEAARQLGIFGAPTFTTADGELFWGNDRLESALVWARRNAQAPPS
jgi:2-hydroxychromene-2-carboxylate isomerase